MTAWQRGWGRVPEKTRILTEVCVLPAACSSRWEPGRAGHLAPIVITVVFCQVNHKPLRTAWALDLRDAKPHNSSCLNGPNTACTSAGSPSTSFDSGVPPLVSPCQIACPLPWKGRVAPFSSPVLQTASPAGVPCQPSDDPTPNLFNLIYCLSLLSRILPWPSLEGWSAGSQLCQINCY